MEHDEQPADEGQGEENEGPFNEALHGRLDKKSEKTIREINRQLLNLYMPEVNSTGALAEILGRSPPVGPGRPPGPSNKRAFTKDEFLPAYEKAKAVIGAREGRKPKQSEIAVEMGITYAVLRRYKREYDVMD